MAVDMFPPPGRESEEEQEDPDDDPAHKRDVQARGEQGYRVTLVPNPTLKQLEDAYPNKSYFGLHMGT